MTSPVNGGGHLLETSDSRPSNSSWYRPSMRKPTYRNHYNRLYFDQLMTRLAL